MHLVGWLSAWLESRGFGWLIRRAGLVVWGWRHGLFVLVDRLVGQSVRWRVFQSVGQFDRSVGKLVGRLVGWWVV